MSYVINITLLHAPGSLLQCGIPPA
jgi:hypothetical protein